MREGEVVGVSIQANMIARVHYRARVKMRAPEGIYYQDVPWPPPPRWVRVVPLDETPSLTDYLVDQPPDFYAMKTYKEESFILTKWRCGDREWVEYIHESDWPMDTKKTLCDHPRQVVFKRLDGFDPVASLKKLLRRLGGGK